MLILCKKCLNFSSNNNDLSSKNLTFNAFFAIVKMFVKLIIEYIYLLITMTNIKNAK